MRAQRPVWLVGALALAFLPTVGHTQQQPPERQRLSIEAGTPVTVYADRVENLDRDRLLIAATARGADPEAQLARWDAELAEPMAEAVRSGHVQSASLLLGDVSYTVERANRYAFWRRARPWSELLA